MASQLIKIKGSIAGEVGVQRTLLFVTDRVRERLQEAILRSAAKVESDAKANATGGVLQAHTGRLSRSINTVLVEQKTRVAALVGTPDFVGNIQEHGRIIGKETAQAKLHRKRFRIRSRVQAAAAVGGNRVPPKPWLSMALNKNRAAIISALAAAADLKE